LFFVIGLSFYLYAPLASWLNPVIDWENAKTVSGFLRLVTRWSYGTFRAYIGSVPSVTNQIFDSFSLIIFSLHDFKPLGILLIILGFFKAFKRKKPFDLFILTNFFIGVFFLFDTNFRLGSSFILAIFERYLTFIYLNLVFFMAIGLVLASEGLKKISSRYIKHNSIKILPILSFYCLLIVFYGLSFVAGYQSMATLKNDDQFAVYAQAVLQTPPKNSILFMRGDTPYFTTQYFYSVKNVRPDLKFIFLPLLPRDYYAQKIKSTYPQVFIPSQRFDKKSFYDDFLQKNNQKFPIFFEGPVSFGYWQPYGLLWKYYPTKKAAKADTEMIIRQNNRFWADHSIPNLTEKNKNFLFLVNLKDIYTRSLASFINLLVVNKRFTNANRLITKFSKNFTESERVGFYSDMAIKKGDCQELKKYADYIINHKELTYDSLFLSRLIKYYGLCDKNNPRAYKYLKLYRRYKNPAVIR